MRRNRWPRVLGAVVGLGLLVPAGAYAQTTERFSKTVRLGRTGTVDLSNLAGDITITGGNSEEVTIDALKRTRRSNAAAQLQSVTIEVLEGPSRVDVRTFYPRRRNINVWVDYTVTVPRGSTVSVRSLSGSITLSDIDGEVRGESASGHVTASAARVARLHSLSGNVEMRAGSGDSYVSTMSGVVTVTGAKLRSLSASSVSGRVRLIDVITDRANANSMSGSIEYSGPLAKGGRYELKSHSGSIVLGIQGPTGFDLDANTFSGSIDTEIPVTVRSDSRGRQRAVRGTFGDGSAVVVVSTFSGEVKVAKR